jgi:hypothetical protein
MGSEFRRWGFEDDEMKMNSVPGLASTGLRRTTRAGEVETAPASS